MPDQYHGVKSRREETFMAKRCITLIGALILLASVSFNAMPSANSARPAGGGQPGGPSTGSGQAPSTGSGQAGGQARGGGPIPSIEDRTNGMRKIDGYFPLYWDDRTGTMFLEIP